mmetsp:Transcript_24100/g.53152  ORF Transcript_24100/g.53152 Transcript_24100/m.53152 type:complete len:206 (-) Transcript_24100:857-1474(-)
MPLRQPYLLPTTTHRYQIRYRILYLNHQNCPRRPRRRRLPRLQGRSGHPFHGTRCAHSISRQKFFRLLILCCSSQILHSQDLCTLFRGLVWSRNRLERFSQPVLPIVRCRRDYFLPDVFQIQTLACNESRHRTFLRSMIASSNRAAQELDKGLRQDSFLPSIRSHKTSCEHIFLGDHRWRPVCHGADFHSPSQLVTKPSLQYTQL